MRSIALLLAAASILSAGIIDDFNRQNNPSLGPNWTVVDGGAQIVGNRASGTSDLSRVIYNGLNSSNAFVDVFANGSNTQYIAIVLGYQGPSSDFFIKVQDNGSSGDFDRAAFYTGNNGAGYFFTLNSPFASGRIWAGYSGSLATLTIDSNFDGTAEQTYTHDYGSPPSGTGVGLGFYGAAQADNFGTGELGNAVPEPASLALVCAGLGLLVWRRVRRS